MNYCFACRNLWIPLPCRPRRASPRFDISLCVGSFSQNVFGGFRLRFISSPRPVSATCLDPCVDRIPVKPPHITDPFCWNLTLRSMFADRDLVKSQIFSQFLRCHNLCQENLLFGKQIHLRFSDQYLSVSAEYSPRGDTDSPKKREQLL